MKGFGSIETRRRFSTVQGVFPVKKEETEEGIEGVNDSKGSHKVSESFSQEDVDILITELEAKGEMCPDLYDSLSGLKSNNG